MAEVHVPVSDLVIGESPRWHKDRLWFAHWGTSWRRSAAPPLSPRAPRASCWRPAPGRGGSP
jgi:hypothetical protein